MQKSLLVSASKASINSPAWLTAKSPALAMRACWRCKSPCPVALFKKVKDCVRTYEKGADNKPSYIPTTVGVGYSLIPRTAPKCVRVAERYSRVSVPKSTRLVASTAFKGERGRGTRCDSPFKRSDKNSSREEYRRSFSTYTFN